MGDKTNKKVQDSPEQVFPVPPGVKVDLQAPQMEVQSNTFVKIVLDQERNYRGETKPAGTVMFTGKCETGFKPEDIDKAIQCRIVKVEF